MELLVAKLHLNKDQFILSINGSVSSSTNKKEIYAPNQISNVGTA